MSGWAGRDVPVFVSWGPSLHTQGIANCCCGVVGKFPPGQVGFWRYLLGRGDNFGHGIRVTVVRQVVGSSCIVQGVGLDDPGGPFQLYDSMILYHNPLCGKWAIEAFHGMELNSIIRYIISH